MKLLQLYSQLAKALISCPPAGGVAMNETVVRDITSLNSKFFHIDLCRMQELQRSPSQESDIVDLVYESGTTEFSSSWSGINVYHLCNFLEIRGTSSSAVAVPVAAEYLEDIHLELSSSEKQDTSSGKNVRARYILAHKSHHHVPS
ncbi:hypothetical protein D5086_009418 [Populus alba]|uniref:Uncharacterized protein n=1 Tax=Populus alba TaxID=43335 RepID=A0ACC4CJA2_POPAL